LADARGGALSLLSGERPWPDANLSQYKRAAQTAPFSPSGNPKETVGSLMGVLAFHEVYHVGQVGMLRRWAGLERVV
jgi:uncharacterized damage-inducible protein DinB